MEPMGVKITEEGTTQQRLSVDPLPFARNYQLEARETAIKQNTIVFLDTGPGKTLIAAMLLRSYEPLLRKPSPFFAVFLVPEILLVQHHSEALMMHTDLKVGKYRGGKGANYRHPASWSKEVDQHEVLVMTPAILLDALRRSCLKIDMIKVLIFDECHNAGGKHPYACIMTEFYHKEMNSKNSNLPLILGMTASPIKAKDCRSESAYWKKIHKLENLMHSQIYTCASESVLAEYISSSTTKLKFFESGDIPHGVFKALANELKLLQNKSECSLETCTLDFPRGCPIQTADVKGNPEQLKQPASLEACKQLHQIGALTDNLLPDMVEEEKEAQQINGLGGNNLDQVKYVPSELVACASNDSRTVYHCYLIKLEPDFDYNVKPHNIMLALRTRLEYDNETWSFDLDDNNGSLRITLRYDRVIELNPEKVLLCQSFQQTVLRVLIDHKLDMLHEVLDELRPRGECAVFDYLLLPTTRSDQHPLIDWECVSSVRFPSGIKKHVDFSPDRCHGRLLRTFRDSVCSCMLENCLVVTPHNDELYCISGILNELDGNSSFASKKRGRTTYKAYFKQRHNITLEFVEQPLLRGKPVFSVKNYLHRGRSHNANVPREASVHELPPELCKVVMSPISVASFYSFRFAPSIMHRIESLLLAATLKSMLVDFYRQNDIIPTIKVLEAITTNECKENFNLESLETLGDSFLKYVVSQQLFKTNQNDRQGSLTEERKKIVANVSLSKLGCSNKIWGFIRNEPFDPKTWIIPGDNIRVYSLEGEFLFSRKNFFGKGRRREIISENVAEVVEALIGAFLHSGGELAALSFIQWLGVKVDFMHRPYTMPLQLNPLKLDDVEFLESLFNYKFQDISLLVEALTHGSYRVSKIPRSYKRLEFLGDAVLDYVVTKYLYDEHPGLSPKLLTNLRSVLVNNDRHAQSAVKVGLYKHILHFSEELKRQIDTSVQDFVKSSVGWESEIVFSDILADIVESVAGAILVDAGYSTERVFESMRPRFLEPMVTPETLKLHPVMELNELCDKHHYGLTKDFMSNNIGKTVTVKVVANGVIIINHSRSSSNEEMADRIASKDVLKMLKEIMSSANT